MRWVRGVVGDWAGDHHGHLVLLLLLPEAGARNTSGTDPNSRIGGTAPPTSPGVCGGRLRPPRLEDTGDRSVLRRQEHMTTNKLSMVEAWDRERLAQPTRCSAGVLHVCCFFPAMYLAPRHRRKYSQRKIPQLFVCLLYFFGCPFTNFHDSKVFAVLCLSCLRRFISCERHEGETCATVLLHENEMLV